MSLIHFQQGDELPELKKPPITKEQLKAYAKASQDPNLIHLDDEVAKKMGLPGVIAHGMLTMAFMGEFLYQTLDFLGWRKGRIQSQSCRFKTMTFPGDVITITGKIKEISGADLPDQIICEFVAKNQKNEITCTGLAVLVTE